MIDLNDLFTNAPTVTLIEPRGETPYFLKSMRLLINDGGLMRELTITADLMTSRETFEDEGCLALSVIDVSEPWRQPSAPGEFVDDGESVVTDDTDPQAEWFVTPSGEQFELHVISAGLFGNQETQWLRS